MSSLKIFGRLNILDQSFYIAVFLVLFFIGIMGGRSIGVITFSSEYSQMDIVGESTSRLDNGQQNLLVITVDQMDSTTPVLESIWLLITHPEISNLTLVPIYPGNLESPSSTNLLLSQPFTMTAQKTPQTEFLNLISQRIYWDNYLIVDQKGVSSILRILHQFAEGLPGNKNQPISILLPQTGQETNRSLENQIQIWNVVCQELSQISKVDKMEDIINQISPHIHTNLSWEQYSQQWSFNQPDDFQIVCEFPTLTLNNP